MCKYIVTVHSSTLITHLLIQIFAKFEELPSPNGSLCVCVEKEYEFEFEIEETRQIQKPWERVKESERERKYLAGYRFIFILSSLLLFPSFLKQNSVHIRDMQTRTVPGCRCARESEKAGL